MDSNHLSTILFSLDPTKFDITCFLLFVLRNTKLTHSIQFNYYVY